MMIKVLVMLVICAQVSAEAQSQSRVKRVIEGEDSDHSQAPYMVSIQSYDSIPIFDTHTCGGTLIADRWVLTAAHCFGKTRTPSDWRVRMGSPNRESTMFQWFRHQLSTLFGRKDWQQMVYYPKTIIIHPSYVPGAKPKHDIALVELRETVPLSETNKVGLVELAESGEDINSSSCNVYGWGYDGPGSAMSETIQVASLPMIPDSNCSNIWPIESEIQLCAGGNHGTVQSADEGDSGGPLVCETTAGVRKQVGVISFIYNKYTDIKPVVFTRVSWYADWIRETKGQ